MIVETVACIRSGTLRPMDLVEACLERIAQWESQVHAWVVVDAEGARGQAKDLERKIQNGQWPGPMTGIPVGIKDLVDVAGFPTLAGSRLRTGHVAHSDAP